MFGQLLFEEGEFLPGGSFVCSNYLFIDLEKVLRLECGEQGVKIIRKAGSESAPMFMSSQG